MACRHATAASPTACKETPAGPLAQRSQVVLDYLPCVFGQLELDRPPSLPLPNRRAFDRVAVGCDVLDLESHHVAAAQLAQVGKDAPLGRAVQRCGTIVATPILSGLHHGYARILVLGRTTTRYLAPNAPAIPDSGALLNQPLDGCVVKTSAAVAPVIAIPDQWSARKSCAAHIQRRGTYARARNGAWHVDCPR